MNQHLSTVRRLVEKNADAFTEPALRWMIFRSAENGLQESGAIVRVPGSRRILIDVDKFFGWLDSHQLCQGGAGGDSAGPAVFAVRLQETSPQSHG